MDDHAFLYAYNWAEGGYGGLGREKMLLGTLVYRPHELVGVDSKGRIQNLLFQICHQPEIFVSNCLERIYRNFLVHQLHRSLYLMFHVYLLR
jgi:hypothetical protein